MPSLLLVVYLSLWTESCSRMKKRLLYLLFTVVIASIAGGLYLYTIKAGEEGLQDVISQSDSGPAADEAILSSDAIVFTNSGPAPDFSKLSGWLNSNPLNIQDLRGKAVLINFWTYSCVDCTKAVPYLSKWQNNYKDHGLVVIGIHTPQYAFEKLPWNVANAIKGQGISYPVAQDNDYKTWTAYHNQFWPSTYLVDQNGTIVYTQLGGGRYGQTEKAIRTLLGLEGDFKIPDAPLESNPNQTPDIYTGLTKLHAYGGTEKAEAIEQVFVFPKKLAKNKFALEGSWKFTQENVIHTHGYGRLLLNFNAAEVFMVAQSPEPVTVKVYIDGVLAKGVVVKDSGLYQLFDSLTPGEHTLRLEFPNETLEIFSFTFG